MKKYYLHDGVNESGPYGVEDLKSLPLKKDTPVWHDGLSEWTIAGNVNELREFITATPPAFKSQVTTTATFEESYPPQYQLNRQIKPGSSGGRKLLTWSGVIVLALLAVYVYIQIQDQQLMRAYQSQTQATADAKTFIREHITSYVTAERNNYTYNKLGGIYNLKISVSNSTDYIMDNVKVKITYYKANGGVWDTKIVDFNMVDAQSKVTLSIPDTNRGTRVEYEIVSIKSNALGLN